ncbi:MAG: hypothetical protein LUG99_06990 [Lachnospiraceae bacterium]|nr:hypothetical protein [Lachnospiraceae bacterium]
MTRHKNKFICSSLLLALSLCLGACQANTSPVEEDTEPQTNVEETTIDASYNASDTDEMLTTISEMFSTASQNVTDAEGVLLETIGESYDSYIQSVSDITEFYENELNTADGLYSMMADISIDYFRCVSAQGLEDFDTWDDSLGDFYDAWDDGMDDYYDAWDDAFDDIYDHCDDLLDDAYDNGLNYDDYYDAWDDMYDEYSDARSDMYNLYSDSWSDIYDIYSDVWSGFYNGQSDVDAILNNVVVESSEMDDSTDENTASGEDTEKATESADTDEADDEMIDGMRTEFKEAMDEYEAFFDEYCEFMEEYKENPTDADLLSSYSSIMTQYAETMESKNALGEEELNDAELAYYIEVTARIEEKLIDCF